VLVDGKVGIGGMGQVFFLFFRDGDSFVCLNWCFMAYGAGRRGGGVRLAYTFFFGFFFHVFLGMVFLFCFRQFVLET